MDLGLFDTQTKTAGYAQVALEQGIDAGPTGLTYAVPVSLGDLHVGDRVMVPLGKRNRPVPYGIFLYAHRLVRTDVKRLHSRLCNGRGFTDKFA